MSPRSHIDPTAFFFKRRPIGRVQSQWVRREFQNDLAEEGDRCERGGYPARASNAASTARPGGRKGASPIPGGPWAIPMLDTVRTPRIG
jgi:hypothetical protein